MKLKHALCGWVPSDFDLYKETYLKYGGSVNMHPDVVRFFMDEKILTFDFWHTENNGDITAAYFVTNKKYPGLNVWQDYPISYDEIILPAAPEHKVILPTKTNRLSSVLRGCVLNSIPAFGQAPEVYRIKESFSTKTTRKRNGELKRFISAGGEIRPLAEMSASVIADLYVALFRSRFVDSVWCYDRFRIEALLSALPQMVSGNALFYNGEPCALDLMLCADSRSFLYVDVPNGGFDPELSSFSPGSLVMWTNILSAQEQCRRENKTLYFSIGRNGKGWGYKQQWADLFPVRKVLIF
ncbi:Mig-14 family protein [Klebsiella variicola]|uniref:Mig-14 family protein n=1 Tax=Klebsiella variicola TaxID=244366 RepID=UPI003753D52D